MTAPDLALVFKGGKREGEAVRLPPAPTRLVLGNRKSAHIPVHDPWISWDHAAFAWQQGELWVEDLKSANGTYVNKERVSRHRVRPGDQLWLGKTEALITASDQLTGERISDPNPRGTASAGCFTAVLVATSLALGLSALALA